MSEDVSAAIAEHMRHRKAVIETAKRVVANHPDTSVAEVISELAENGIHVTEEQLCG